MALLKNIKQNVLLTIIITLICFLILINSGVLDNHGMAVIIVMWLPVLIGVLTLILYLITNYFTKKWAWIITIIGNVLNVLFLISAFLEKN